MVEAQVHLAPASGQPATVSWVAPTQDPPKSPGRPAAARVAAAPTRPGQPRGGARLLSPTRRVESVIDEWHYRGRWWQPPELSRHYYLLQLEGGTQLELFEEGGGWWAARVSD